MIAIATTAPAQSRSAEGTHRVLAVTRLHFVNRFQMVILPLMILVFILIMNVAIWAIVVAVTPEHSRLTVERHRRDSRADLAADLRRVEGPDEPRACLQGGGRCQRGSGR